MPLHGVLVVDQFVHSVKLLVLEIEKTLVENINRVNYSDDSFFIKGLWFIKHVADF